MFEFSSFEKRGVMRLIFSGDCMLVASQEDSSLYLFSDSAGRPIMKTRGTLPDIAVDIKRNRVAASFEKVVRDGIEPPTRGFSVPEFDLRRTSLRMPTLQRVSDSSQVTATRVVFYFRNYS